MTFCLCCSPAVAGLRPRRRAVLAGLLAGTTLLASGPAQAGPLDALLRSLVTPEKERELGERAFAQIKRQKPRSRDPALQRRLEATGGRIVRASGAALPLPKWEFVAFAGKEVNAFALPGGKVGVFEGMFQVAEDEAWLATVLGHEVAHVVARHAAERIGAAIASDLGTSILGWALDLDPASGLDRLAAAVIGSGVEYGLLRPYGRAQELEADRLGRGYMACAGFDPTAALGFWQAMSRTGGGKPPMFLSTHPSDAARIEQLRR